MIQRFLKFLQGCWSKLWARTPVLEPVRMENYSTLEPLNLDLNILSTIPVTPQTIEIKLKAYCFNILTNSLEKVNISFNADLVDILHVSPSGVVGLNSLYQVVSVQVLPENLYLMNTPEFPCQVFRDEQEWTYQELETKDIQLTLKVESIIETLKNKQVSYPVITEKYLEYNQKFLSSTEYETLFKAIFSTPVNSLAESLDIFDQHLSKNKQRVWGHRWSLNPSYYYSESKLSALDQTNFKDHATWTNAPLNEVGMVAVVSLETNLLIEVVGVGLDYIWAVDRQLAAQYLLLGESKDQALVKAQRKILKTELTQVFVIQN